MYWNIWDTDKNWTKSLTIDLVKLLEIEWSSFFELTLTLNLTLIKSFNCRFTRTQWVGCRNSEYILRAFPTVEFTSAVQHRITTTSSKLVAPSGQFHPKIANFIFLKRLVGKESTYCKIHQMTQKVDKSNH